jgi:hypothetical protein
LRSIGRRQPGLLGLALKTAFNFRSTVRIEPIIDVAVQIVG